MCSTQTAIRSCSSTCIFVAMRSSTGSVSTGTLYRNGAIDDAPLRHPRTLARMTQADRRHLANQHAVERIAAALPVLTGCERASSALNLADGELGHAGPPFDDLTRIPAP